MKKITLAIGAFLIVNCSMAHQISTSKSNPSSAGTYKTIGEVHNDDIDALSCFDPGDVTCQWATKPKYMTIATLNGIEKDVQSEIALGNFSGKTAIGDNTVTWDASSESNYSFTVDVPTE